MPRKRIPHEVDDAKIEENAQGRPELIPFAKTLNALLIKKGIHQEDMAQALGISTGSISGYRNGEKEPRLFMIIKMADYLGVDCHYLMTGVQAENSISSKELGLSEEAINAIKEMGKSCDVLNRILAESIHFEDVLMDIDKLAWEESTRKAAEMSADMSMNRGKAACREEIQDFTIKVLVGSKAEERRDVIEYRILKKFKRLLDIVVNDLTTQKNYREYGAKMLESGYHEEAEFFNDLNKGLSAEGEEENYGQH